MEGVFPMAIELRLAKANDIPGTNARLHDCWFSVDAIGWDTALGQVRMPFARDSKGCLAGDVDSLLIIDGVKQLIVEDTERIGCYDLNRFDLAGNVLRLIAGIPTKVLIEVSWQE